MKNTHISLLVKNHVHQSKWIVCFCGDIYLHLKHKYQVSTKILVSNNIEEFWYRISNISIDIEEFWYQTSTTSVAYCAYTGNCVLYEYQTYNVSIVGIEYRTKFRYRSVSNKTWYRTSPNRNSYFVGCVLQQAHAECRTFRVEFGQSGERTYPSKVLFFWVAS